MQPDTSTDEAVLDRRRRILLLASVFLIATCGLVYELVTGAAASYLIGNSVTQYSLVIGFFLAAMGVGAWLTQFVHERIMAVFIASQIGVGLLGGFSAMILFATFSTGFDLSLAVILVTSCVGTMVGMEIPLLIRIIRGQSALRVTVPQVLSIDYLGALVASLVFPFLLLPWVGMVRASLLFGLLNILVALLGLVLFRRELEHFVKMTVAASLAFVLLVIGIAAAENLTTRLEASLYQDEIIHAETTPYQRIIISRWHDDIRLYLNGHLQFAAADEYRYHESLVWPAMAVADAANPQRDLRVLILGGGDGLAIREVFKTGRVSAIDLVDLDQRVVELFRDRPVLAALNQGSLKDSRVTPHFTDAFVFLRRTDLPQYDVIIMDLPDPSSPATNKLFTRPFFAMAMKHLAAGGVMVTQATSPFYAREAFWCIVNTMKSAAGLDDGETGRRPRLAADVLPYHVHVPSFGDWGFVMATRHHVNTSNIKIAGSGRFLDNAVLQAAFVFPADVGPIATPVNTLDRPRLVEYHNSGWDRWNE